jgi:hypothetical protein
MPDTNDTEMAYFAGFFDGEGCVAIYVHKYVVSITNTDVRPLKRAKELWGGTINVQKRETLQGALQDLRRWSVYGRNSREFLNAILPYLIVKKEQVNIYLAILDLLPNKPIGSIGYSKNTHDTIYDGATKLRQLKREGVKNG